MKNTIYTNLKSELKEVYNQVKSENKKDKPYLRECINNHLDTLLRRLNDHYFLHEHISEKQKNLYSEWLTNYAIKLHN